MVARIVLNVQENFYTNIGKQINGLYIYRANCCRVKYITFQCNLQSQPFITARKRLTLDTLTSVSIFSIL